MRIFVLGVGGAGSLLAQLLARQGHTVWCGDRDPDRARKFLGKKSAIEVKEANARNLWSIVRAARGCNLLVNASPAVFNEIILRAALRLGVHYLDLNSHLNRNPFKPEQFRFRKRFEAKNRAALICTGAAPGLTNLLAKRGSELLDAVESVQIRLYESTESKDPVSTWSPEVMYDEAISSPRVYRHGRFSLAKRFADREKFRFPPPIGETTVYLAAQDEVCMLPYVVPMRDMDAKIGGNDFDRLFRWYRQGRLNRSQGIVRKRFPKTLTPKGVAGMIRKGALENARFAAAVLGARRERRSTAAAALRRELPYAPSDSPARLNLDAHRLRHRASRRHLHQTFSPRHGRRLRPVGTAHRNAPRHPRRSPFPRFSRRVQNDPPEENRRRRILAVPIFTSSRICALSPRECHDHEGCRIHEKDPDQQV